MLSIKKGSIVSVCIEEGHCLINYFLKVLNIEEEYNDDYGNYCCNAFGIGITPEDSQYAEDYTHIIDSMNFDKVIH